MSKHKKISINEFVTDKQIKKLEKIIYDASDVSEAYDNIESLLSKNFEAKDLGTNRLILISRKKKYKDYVIKVAGDSHGIEANYREFYNGDLSKDLTQSYSISKNGVILVQERVKPFTSKIMEKHKKDVRKMLKRLEPIILLVDCKLSNFKNFGLRDNGKVCLLDHGDTVPLTEYKNGAIVNIMEETNVSLRCKEIVEKTRYSKNPKMCGGKLRYSKNYDYFICDKCGCKSTINTAYRDIYLNADAGKNANLALLKDGFDPVAYAEEHKKQIQESIKQYAKDVMEQTEDKKGENKMNKEFNNHDCVQIKGFWIPTDIDKSDKFEMKLSAVKRGLMHPAELLKELNLDIEDYKVRKIDHNTSKKFAIKPAHNPKDIINFIYDNKDIFNTITMNNQTYITVPFETINDHFNINLIDDMSLLYAIQGQLKLDDKTTHSKFDAKSSMAFFIHFKEDSTKKDPHEYEAWDSTKEDCQPFDDDADNEPDDVDDLDDDDLIEVSYDNLSKADVVKICNIDCILFQDYYIPRYILEKYYDEETKSLKLPDAEIILVSNGMDPSVFKKDTDDEDEVICYKDELDEDYNDSNYVASNVSPIDDFDDKVIEDDDNNEDDKDYIDPSVPKKHNFEDGLSDMNDEDIDNISNKYKIESFRFFMFGNTKFNHHVELSSLVLPTNFSIFLNKFINPTESFSISSNYINANIDEFDTFIKESAPFLDEFDDETAKDYFLESQDYITNYDKIDGTMYTIELNFSDNMKLAVMSHILNKINTLSAVFKFIYGSNIDNMLDSIERVDYDKSVRLSENDVKFMMVDIYQNSNNISDINNEYYKDFSQFLINSEKTNILIKHNINNINNIMDILTLIVIQYIFPIHNRKRTSFSFDMSEYFGDGTSIEFTLDDVLKLGDKIKPGEVNNLSLQTSDNE